MPKLLCDPNDQPSLAEVQALSNEELIAGLRRVIMLANSLIMETKRRKIELMLELIEENKSKFYRGLIRVWHEAL